LTVTDWFQFIQENDDTSSLAGCWIASTTTARQWNTINLIEVSACFTAIRLDQMAKENRHDPPSFGRACPRAR
jgi:hypothetical protein